MKSMADFDADKQSKLLAEDKEPAVVSKGVAGIVGIFGLAQNVLNSNCEINHNYNFLVL